MTDTDAERSLLVIVPGSVPIRRYLLDLWHHRDLIRVFALRDLKLRYRQTVLGASWVVLQPLLAGGVLGFIFGRVAKLSSGGVNPYVFAFAGMLGWGLFSSCVTRTTSSLIGNASLVSKIFFPRLALPLSTSAAVVVDFLVSFAVLVVAEFSFGGLPGWGVLSLPLWVALTLMLALGIGSFLASLSVRYRDIPQVTPVLLQLGLYASPVAYSVSVIPARFLGWYYLNPLAALIEAFHWSTVGTPPPPAGRIVYAATVAVAVFVAGMFTLERMEKGFADVI